MRFDNYALVFAESSIYIRINVKDGAYEAGICAQKHQPRLSKKEQGRKERLAKYAKSKRRPEDGHHAPPNGIFVSVFIQTSKSL